MKKAKDGVQAALDAQKKRRADVQAASDKRKAEAMSKRAAAGLPTGSSKIKVTKAPATGSDIRKYMKPEDPILKNVKQNAQIKSGNEYYQKLANPVKKAGGKRKVARTASAAIEGPKRELPSVSAPKPAGIQKGPEKKQYSKTESKIAGEIQKIKSGKNAEASQARIKALKAKDAAQKMRAEKKSKRMEKRAAVKAVKESYK